MTDESITIESDLSELDEDMEELAAPEFTCHCCYDVLVDPTTLNCGHSFCRHCLAEWLHSSRRNECPECRERWQGFPRINILLRLLAHLGDKELSAAPFNVKNPSHRQIILEEIQEIKALKVKLPQNLWGYKAANLGKSLFLQFGLREFPRLTFLYLYLFDYEDTFLPFIHTCCPAHRTNAMQDIPPENILQEPSQHQWVKFRVKVCLMPYLLLVDFAWQWLSVHYWISWIVIGNAMVVTVMEYVYVWTLWRRRQMSTLPKMILQKMFNMFFVVLLWPLMPQFLCDFEFYCGLFFSSFIYISVRKSFFKLAQQ
uniref:RING-type domain-containing protein n=1 Tax=Cyprinus carpio carpio TaxID=630221 RepID=A0A9J7X2P3_CYPCA